MSLETSLAVVPPVVEEQGHEQEHVKEEMTVQEVILKLKIVILMLVQVSKPYRYSIAKHVHLPGSESVTGRSWETIQPKWLKI